MSACFCIGPPGNCPCIRRQREGLINDEEKQVSQQGQISSEKVFRSSLGIDASTTVSPSEDIYRSASNNLERATKIHARVIAIRDRLFSSVNDEKGCGTSPVKPTAIGFVGRMQFINADMQDMLGYIETVLGEIERF